MRTKSFTQPWDIFFQFIGTIALLTDTQLISGNRDSTFGYQ